MVDSSEKCRARPNEVTYTTLKTTKYVKNVIKCKKRVGNVYGELKKYSKALKRE